MRWYPLRRMILGEEGATSSTAQEWGVHACGVWSQEWKAPRYDAAHGSTSHLWYCVLPCRDAHQWQRQSQHDGPVAENP
jgi:hypothetical protein